MAGYSSLEILAIQRAYESMLADIHPFVNAPEHLALIDKAYRYCLEKYDGKYLVSGKAYMLHLIEMGRIAVLEVGLGYISVAASFLHGIDYKENSERPWPSYLRTSARSRSWIPKRWPTTPTTSR